MNTLSIVVPLLVALLAGGGVALFTARPTKDSINVVASQAAVAVVNDALGTLKGELTAARDRITLLEKERTDCNQRIENLEERLRSEVERLNGT